MWQGVALGGLTGLAGLTWARATRREARARRENPPRGTFVEISGTRMHALVAGEGPDLVLIHGLSGSLNDFSFALLPALARHFRVIAIDRPGKGWSEAVKDGWRLEVQALLIRKTARRLGADRPLVLGHSYGGSVGLAWAVHEPSSIAGLVTVSSPSHVRPDRLDWYYTVTSHPALRWAAIPVLAAWVGETQIAASIDEVFAPQAPPTGYASHFGPAMTIRRAAMRANAACRKHLLAEIALLAPHYPDLDLPLEIVHGSADRIVPAQLHAEALARDVPGAHLALLDGIGHMPQHVAIPEVTAAAERAAERAGLRAG